MKVGKEDSIIFSRVREKRIVDGALEEIRHAVTRTLERIERFKSYEGFENQYSRDYSIAKEKRRLEDLTVAYEKWKNNITQKST